MSRPTGITFVVLLYLFVTFTAPVAARRSGSSGRHSYPSSHGLSGNPAGHSSYSYPHSTGLSGSNTHHVHHQAPVNSAPSKQSYPPSSGLSGHGTQGHYQHAYNPPPQIHYTPVHGAPPAHPYPVYHGSPPVYVHHIQDSGSRFSTLLTGLALYNLGRHAAGHHEHVASGEDKSGEKCTLRIEQDRNVETVKIPCYIVSTFTDANNVNKALNSSTTTVAPAVKVATILDPTATMNATSAANATLSDDKAVLNATAVHNTTTVLNTTEVLNTTAAVNTTAVGNDTVSSMNSTTVVPVTPTTPNATEAVDALQVKGEPIKLSKDARCFVEKVTKTSSSKKEIECGLLQQYALQSMQKQKNKPNSANHVMSQMFVLFVSTISYLVIS